MKIIKRDGQEVEFEKDKIISAIEKAMYETKVGVDTGLSAQIAEDIQDDIVDMGIVPSVESVQNMCEEYLMDSDRKDVAKKYILYRNERDQVRGQPTKQRYQFLSDDFISTYKHRPDPFPSELGKFVYYRTYSRPIPSEGRRERWWETVARVVDFSSDLELKAMKRQGLVVNEITINRLISEAEKIYDMMYNLKLFPSGRTLWTGGTTASYMYPLSNFNCSFLTIDQFTKFSEMFFVLMLGTGVGLSVEKKYVDKLPKINSKIDVIHKDVQEVPSSLRNEHTELKHKGKNVLEIVVGDSKSAWREALDMYFTIISSKQYVDIDFILVNYDNVRPAGERLKTFGGHASGHTAIKQMFNKMNNLIQRKRREKPIQWQTIKPIDCLDIATIIAENVVAGGTRRSALIVFCDKDDKETMSAKANLYYQDESGNWVSNDEITHRMLSNNTVLYHEKPTKEELKQQFDLIKTSGEPSFGNFKEMERRREDVQGGNPCFEILLRDRGVCNLTEVNMMGFVNEDGTYNKEGLIEAQRLSGIIGYRMATIELELHEWDLVNKLDMLTGCSLTGEMDFKNATGMSNDEFNKLLSILRDIATNTVNAMADRLKLNRPKLVTCIKPSGTVSQLPSVSSGLHFSHSPYFIRRVRVSANDPLAQAMVDAGFKWELEVGQDLDTHTTKVFEFPTKAPEGRTKYDVSAIEQLELYKSVMTHYVDHNASNTVHVRPEEWDEVVEWFDKNWDSVVGVTFLSLDDSFYQLMPYEAITKKEYEEMLENTPTFNPSTLRQYENFEEEFDIEDSDCDGVGFCPIR